MMASGRICSKDTLCALMARQPCPKGLVIWASQLQQVQMSIGCHMSPAESPFCLSLLVALHVASFGSWAFCDAHAEMEHAC